MNYVRENWKDTNPYFAAYCIAHGAATVEEGLAKQTHKGGDAEMYIIWIEHRWKEWCELRDVKREARKGPEQQRDFEDWLVDLVMAR